MATRFVRTTQNYASASTNRFIFVPTTAATQVYITTGYNAMRIYNAGSHNLVWGGSGVQTNSGSFLFPSMAKEFENLSDSFSFHIIADSANSFISVTEYIYG